MKIEDHLFRREAGRMTATLTRIFGVHNLALAEDVVQDAFCRALDVWRFRGVPENPAAWLMATAKNRALDVLRRERTARTFAPELGRLLESEWSVAPMVEELFGATSIQDDQLRMMFSCCHPRLPEEAQIAVMLNILCGFSVDEVAAAFLASHSAIEKRISRAKKALAQSKRLFEIADADDFAVRLAAVHRALYLLFSEGYHGASPEAAVRAELCNEAMRLTSLLHEHLLASTPATYALSALMCFHAARLSTRVDGAGNLCPLHDQDRTLWDTGLIAEGRYFLERSASGGDVSEYHIEAAIASLHVSSATAAETDWELIVSLYSQLLNFRPSPVIELNRAVAIAQHHGPESGLKALRAIENAERLTGYPFYFSAMGEFELRLHRHESAYSNFQKALALARNDSERRFLQQRLNACDGSLVKS